MRLKRWSFALVLTLYEKSFYDGLASGSAASFDETFNCSSHHCASSADVKGE
jgi:hypothetical protein